MSPSQRRIHEYWSVREVAYRLTDAASIIVGWLLASRWGEASVVQAHMLAATCAIIVFHVVGEITGMYRNWRGVSIERETMCSLATWGATTPILLAIGSVTGFVPTIPRGFLLCWLALAMCSTLLTRLLLRLVQGYLRARGLNVRGFAIVGINELGFQLADNIEKSPEMGLELRGFFDDRGGDRTPEIDPGVGHRVGDLNDLVRQARSGEVNMVYITFPMRAEQRIKNVLSQLADTTASVYIVPDFFVFELLHSRWTNIGGLPSVSVFENPFYGVDGFVKRALDIALASILLIALAIPMLLIAALIKATSKGPVFFRQRRYGLDGREILVWKFRSMKVCEDGFQVVQAKKHDSRTTPLGAILRRTSLDELPQLLNVLTGTMSLVGPRPHASAHNEEYRSRIRGYMLRHKVRPGITGLAQVSGWRGETDTLEKMAKRVECDHRYIREWSLLMDVKILFKTIFVVFSRQNAY